MNVDMSVPQSSLHARVDEIAARTSAICPPRIACCPAAFVLRRPAAAASAWPFPNVPEPGLAWRSGTPSSVNFFTMSGLTFFPAFTNATVPGTMTVEPSGSVVETLTSAMIRVSPRYSPLWAWSHSSTSIRTSLYSPSPMAGPGTGTG